MRRWVVLLVALTMLVASLGGGSGLPGPVRAAETSRLLEYLYYLDTGHDGLVTVIVRLSEEPAAVHAAAFKNLGQQTAAAARAKQLGKVRAEQARVMGAIGAQGVQVTPGFRFEEAYNGFTLTLPANEIPLLAGIPGITGIFADVEVVHHRVFPEGDDHSIDLHYSVDAVGAPAAWAAGYTGEGILVAILDDGVDYTHPHLGGGIGPGFKVVGGYDFRALRDDPMPVPGDSHGTHVAATAAGLYGVAPGASILAVRVLGGSLFNNLSPVMAGIDYAVRMGAHVANMSLGLLDAYGPTDNPWAEMVSNAVRAGVVFTNSNGNNGPAYYTVGMYASSPHAIGVGAVDVRPIPYPRVTVVETGAVLVGGAYSVPFPAELLGVELDVVDVGFGNTPAYYEGKNVAGKIAIALRGGLTGEDATFVNKGNQALAAGAAGLIIYNDAARWTDFSAAFPALPGFTMSHPNGLAVIANPRIIVDNFEAGYQMAGFSSRGPTVDLAQIKPDISAPGVSIVAAVPFGVDPAGVRAASGTSMAAPHMAGAAALMLQANPSWTPEQVKLAAMNTAADLGTNIWGVQYRVVDQGAGFLDVSRAVAPSLALSPGSVSFGHLTAEHGYTRTRQLTVSTYVTGGRYRVEVVPRGAHAGVAVTAESSPIIHLTGRNRQHTIALTATIDPGLAQAGEYEGYVYLVNTSDPADSYRVPYFLVYRAPVSNLQVSNRFVGAGAHQFIDVTFTTGQPLNNWYLGTMAGTRFTANQGTLAPGTYTVNWNGRTSTGANLAEGGWNIGVWYQLPGSATFVFGATYARIWVDRTRPIIRMDAAFPGLTNQPELVVTGAVSDAAMHNFGGVAGWVMVNGVKAELSYRYPALLFPQNTELAFRQRVTLAEGENTIIIYAEDAAGNRSLDTFTYEVFLDTVAQLTLTELTAFHYRYNRTELVVAGITEAGAVVTINGVEVVVCPEELAFAHLVELDKGTNVLVIEATDPAGNTTTLTRMITVQSNKQPASLIPVR
ncbi:MAG: S8 family serine peptidase [Bacillota bacterium]